MSSGFTREELVARMTRAGELEVSGDAPEELKRYFAPGYRFRGPGGVELDLDGLLGYFASVRDAFDDRSIRRGIVIVEANDMACQTWIEGTFVREFTQSPVGPLPPNNRRVTFDLFNIFHFDDEGRFTDDAIRVDNYDVLTQLGWAP
ncbi:ester cyclase [uncultured Jatrophihabitans sp.]|uniref:ester cyclase n=1 Tax=uncultured Jatrophihabitans sp. TaxID=1610747 RepID=UPI0035CA4116